MTVKTKLGMDLTRAIAGAVVLALVVAVGLYFLLRDSNDRRYTAMFTGTVGLYEGNDVRVLGVKVGTVDHVEPEGKLVKVDLLVDRSVQVPANADAVIVAPSLVSDRYVQLAPVYTGGPELADGTVLADRPHRDPAGGRRPLRQPGPGHRHARPERRQQERRAVGPAEHRRRQRSTATARRCTTRSPSSARRRARCRATRTTCSPPWTTSRSSPARWPRATSR